MESPNERNIYRKDESLNPEGKIRTQNTDGSHDKSEISKSEIEISENNKIQSEAPQTKLVKSNLEFLLSEKDIMPLLMMLNSKNSKGSNLSQFNGSGAGKEQNGFNKETRTSNKRGDNIRETNDRNILESIEDENPCVKIEEQPDNLKGGILKEYQLEGLNWLIRMYYMNINVILADEMGLGKTIETISYIAFIEKMKTKKHYYIIIVPKVTIKNWKREIEKWFPELRVLFFYGDKDARKHLVDYDLKMKEYECILTTYEVAMKEKSALSKIQFELLVIDEAHRIKNEKSKLSIDLRSFKSNHRLLLTGTPLQNNLHELWSLLNFLMPNIFNSSFEFDQVFDLDNSSIESQQLMVKQIHKILKPFMLRRLKSEVQFKIPPKKEIYLYVNLSELQRELYKQILTKNLDLVNGVNKDKIQLLNILMQLKKVCNHPYLFPKIEAGPPFIEGEHIIENSMKLKILDCLLLKLRSEGSRVLIFSQMTTMLNILDDYCRFRDFSYRRIDGSTSTDDRDSRIEEFQSENSDIFIFLLSTRAGGLGINLHKANTVIIYDSDWNPQVDLQAIDRAHRIGQTKTVTIYRFVTEGTVEEKIIERAAKKLKIDNLIIQKGKNIQNRVSAIEMTNMIQYGADKLFAGKQNGNSQDQSILDILKYSENKTEEIFGQLKKLEDKISINNLSLSSDSKDIYQFDGEDFKKYKESTENNFVNISINLGQRERKVLNAALDPQFKVKEIRKPKIVTGWRAMPNVNGGYEHQFYPVEELDELDDKEKAWNEYLERVENEKVSDSEEPPEEFTPEDEERRMKLLKQGFNNWTKKDFARFTKALEIVGIKDYHGLSKFVKGKSIEEIEEFAKYFEKNINKLKGGYKYKARITRLERESSKVADNQVILNTIFTRIVEKSDIIFSTSKQTELKIPYNDRHSSSEFTEEEDKYLLCLLFKYGYPQWTRIKHHILFDPAMKFNLNIKIKSEQEIQERANFLIGLFKSEINKKRIVKKNPKRADTNGVNPKSKAKTLSKKNAKKLRKGISKY